jgi:hypothetical protein
MPGCDAALCRVYSKQNKLTEKDLTMSGNRNRLIMLAAGVAVGLGAYVTMSRQPVTETAQAPVLAEISGDAFDNAGAVLSCSFISSGITYLFSDGTAAHLAADGGKQTNKADTKVMADDSLTYHFGDYRADITRTGMDVEGEASMSMPATLTVTRGGATKTLTGEWMCSS